MKDKELLGRIQGKYHYYLRRFSGYFSRPAWKFLCQMCFGILESSEVKLSKITQDLGEQINMRKMTERLARYLGWRYFGKR